MMRLRELGLQELDDEAVLARAVAEKRAVLTSNLIRRRGRSRGSGTCCGDQVSAALGAHGENHRSAAGYRLTSTRQALASGAVVIVEEARLRIRRLPIGR
jgi:hypothetical protein